MINHSPFRYFKTSPEIIRLAVMIYVCYPFSLRSVEDLLHERGVDISHETIRFWWTRFGPLFAVEIRKNRVNRMRTHSNWQWHLDEIFVKINGETHYLWQALDHEGEVLGKLFCQAPRSQSSIEIQENNEALWPTTCHRDRSTAVLRRRDEGHRQRRSPGNRALAQQPGREFTPAA
jgi:hypothetical protein